VTEPIIVIRDAPAAASDPAARLADVLITTPDGPRGEQLKRLFSAFPGLTLILVTGPGRNVEIGARDGAVASLALDPGISLHVAAITVYHAWVAKIRTHSVRPW
jgi:hypothetical protein